MKRSELYALAWAVPISKLAGRFGLSDRGLAKICERNHIPLPGRGYWAKDGADQYPPRNPLPRPDQDYELPLRETTVLGSGIDAAVQPDQETREKLLNTSGHLPPSESTPGARKLARTTRLSSTRAVPDPVKSAPIDPFDIYSSLGAECERAMSAGMDYQRRQAAHA